MEKRDTFGKLLKFYRKRTKDSTYNFRPLSQQRLAEELKLKEGFTYSYGTVSLWERDMLQISHESRLLLATILKILLRFKGINQLGEANELLRLGGHAPLTDAEVEKVHGRWQLTKPAGYSIKIASHEIQRAALPQQIELQGKDGVCRILNEQLCQPLSPSIVFLTGRGGVGKSAVATALAHKHLTTDIFEAVAWIPVNLPDNQPAEAAINSLTTYLGKWLQIKHFGDATQAGRESLIRGALEAKPHLIVIDGIEAPVHCDALNERLGMMVGRSKFLVTSRTLPTHISQAFVYDLDEIGVNESQQLLQAQTTATNGIPAEEFTEDVTQKIYDAIGGHPLTLILFPHLLKQHSLDRLLEAIESGAEGKHAFIYTRAWEMLSPEAHELIMGLCFFGGLGAGESVLKTVTGLDEEAVYRTVREVSQFGLLQSRGGLNEKVYNLHNLTIQYVQILVRDAADKQKFTQVTKTVFSHWLNHFANPQITLPYELVLKLQQTLRVSQIIQDNADISQLRCELLYTIFTPFKDNGFLHISEAYWHFSLSHDVAADPLFQARLTNQFAFIKQKNREFDLALGLYAKGLELGLQIEDTLEIARTHHHLSWCYYGMQAFKRAEEHNEKAIGIFEEFDIFNEDYVKALLRRGILAAKQNLADKAESAFNDVARYLENTNQPQYLAQTYQNLGILYDNVKSYSAAVSAYNKAQEHLVLFPNKMRQIKLLLAEGSLHLDFENPHKAIEVLQKVDRDFLYASLNFHTLNILQHNLAQSFIKLNRFEEAEVLILESLKYRRKHGQVYEQLLLLEIQALIHFEKRDREKGIAILQQILEAAQQLAQEAKVLILISRVEKQISELGSV